MVPYLLFVWIAFVTPEGDLGVRVSTTLLPSKDQCVKAGKLFEKNGASWACHASPSKGTRI